MEGLTFGTMAEWLKLGLVHATILAVLTWALSRTAFRRSPPAAVAALWTVVLLKFLLPPVLPGEYALGGWVAGIVDFLEDSSQASSQAGLLRVSEVRPTSETAMAAPASDGIAAFLLALFQALLLPAYLLGVSVLALRAGKDWLRIRRKVRKLPAAEGTLADEVRSLAARMRIRRKVAVLCTGEGATPHVLGLWRPRLILPEAMLKRLEPMARQALIVHELAHIRRGDIAVRWAQNVARIFLFFWPPVWWVCRRIERSAEMACDQWALSVSGVSPYSYAKSLLDVAKSIGSSSLSPQELAFARRGRLLEDRFQMILNEKKVKSPRLSWITLVLLAAWASFAWAGGTAQEAEQKQEPKSEVKVLKAGDAAGKIAKIELVLHGILSEKQEEVLANHPEADLNGDGELDRKEYSAFRRQRLADKLMDEHPEIDADGDGLLSQAELRNHMLEVKAQKLEWKFREAEDHSTVDFVIDGEADPNRSHTVIYFKRDGEETARYDFEELDVNNDGRLTSDELEGVSGEHRASVIKLETLHSSDHAVAAEGERSLIGFRSAAVDGDSDLSAEERKKLLKGILVKYRAEMESTGTATLELKERPLAVKRKSNADADLDGDGVVSEEEAKKFAAKLQAATKKRKQQ